MEYEFGKPNNRPIKLRKYIYLISPPKIKEDEFYKVLDKVLKTNKVNFFQLRLKNISNLKNRTEQKIKL